jgi:hypothetical protein
MRVGSFKQTLVKEMKRMYINGLVRFVNANGALLIQKRKFKHRFLKAR